MSEIPDLFGEDVEEVTTKAATPERVSNKEADQAEAVAAHDAAAGAAANAAAGKKKKAGKRAKKQAAEGAAEGEGAAAEGEAVPPKPETLNAKALYNMLVALLVSPTASTDCSYTRTTSVNADLLKKAFELCIRAIAAKRELSQDELDKLLTFPNMKRLLTGVLGPYGWSIATKALAKNDAEEPTQHRILDAEMVNPEHIGSTRIWPFSPARMMISHYLKDDKAAFDALLAQLQVLYTSGVATGTTTGGYKSTLTSATLADLLHSVEAVSRTAAAMLKMGRDA